MKALNLAALSKCTACVTLGKEHVPANGNPNAKIMLIGQSPGATEVEEGAPFVGPCGEILDFFLDEAGLDRTQVYITNALKCHPPGNRSGHIEELRMCKKHWLSDEMKQVNPAIVVLIGKDAWDTITKRKIPFEHGKVSKSKKRTYLTVYHPGYYLRRGDFSEFVTVGRKLRELYEQE